MEMTWGWMRHAAAAILLLGLSFSANAERYWLDNFADPNRTHHPTGEEACVTGVLQRILDEYRASSTQAHEITSINIGPDNGIDERVCQGVISRQAFGSWIPVEQIDTRVFGPRGATPVCNLPGLADPDTGQCGVPKCEEGCEIAGGNGSNPIDSATGNKSQREVDYVGSGVFPLRFERTYNSHRAADVEARPIGVGWSHTYSAHFNPVYEPGGGLAVRMYRPNGAIQKFSYNGSAWTGDPDIPARFAAVVVSGFIESATYTRQDDTVETYNADGRLLTITNRDGLKQILSYATASGTSPYVQKVTDPQGRTLAFSYTNGQITGLMDSYGLSITFGYISGDLVSATYPEVSGTFVRTYLYNEAGQTGGISQPHVLTGIVDENSQRFASWGYDAQRRGALSVHGAYSGGTVERVSIVYNPNGTSAITDMHEETRIYGFDVKHRVARVAALDAFCAFCANAPKSRTYDANGFADLTVDFRDTRSNQDFNARGLETRLIEASTDVSGSRRTIQTSWNPTFRVPTERRTYDASDVLVAKQNWTYNARGQVVTASQTDPGTGAVRTTTTTYCEQAQINAGACPLLGLVTSINGPRTDIGDLVTFTYRLADAAGCASSPATCAYRKGDLWKVSNALAQVTETLSYDGAGRALSIKDANGVITDYEYHPRGWLTARKVRGTNGSSEGDDRITRIEYWPTGLVKQVTQPDGSYLVFTYDAAQRLTRITDRAGFYIHYTLDDAGNRVLEETRNPAGSTLYRTLSRVYNALGQLQTQADATSNPTDFTYDASGNPDTVTDALVHVTDHDYDPLNRLQRTLQDVGGIEAETAFEYDALDNLTKVTDPKGLDTVYTYNGFSELTQLTSPDTGVTSYTYDSAGNRKTQTDARNITASYDYDALNRLTGISYLASSYNVTYSYDSPSAHCASNEAFGTGRLAAMQDSAGQTYYCYDRFGAVVRKVLTSNGRTFTTRYTYTAAGGLLDGIFYPDGTRVDYIRNLLGQVTQVGVLRPGQTRQIVVKGVAYLPFGPAKSWIYGNERQMTRGYDADYLPTSVRDPGTGGISLGLVYDEVDNIRVLTNLQGAWLARYKHDALHRLEIVQDGPTGTPIDTYGYDGTGNRTSHQTSAGTVAYSYPAASHRLASVGGVARGYTANGNTANIGGAGLELVYSADNRMVTARRGGAVVMNYRYNGRGEQVRKFLGTDNTYTAYDETGRWLGDYDSSGVPRQQAIWLDDLPVGLLAGPLQQLHYIEPDHLGSPRVVIEPARNVAVWKWDATGEAFGADPPVQDPDGDGTALVFDMRFPGQRYDSATGLNYNYFRDYDSGSGRYVQSDPIGLSGGLSTYSYGFQNPLGTTDPQGLAVPLVVAACLLDPPCAALVAAGIYVISRGVSSAVQNSVDMAESCPPDDFCGRNAQRLNAERNFLIDAIDIAIKMGDKETLVAVNNDIIKFNREVEAHNRLCRSLMVIPLRTLERR